MLRPLDAMTKLLDAMYRNAIAIYVITAVIFLIGGLWRSNTSALLVSAIAVVMAVAVHFYKRYKRDQEILT